MVAGRFGDAWTKLGTASKSDVEALVLKARLCLHQGQLEQARQTAETVCENAHAAGALRAEAFFFIALSSWELGARAGSAALQEATRLARQVGDAELLARIH